ncbi:hypothetical protein MFLAVUS_010156 [Mucor flavus]|uniref:BZIP domain-containing protein n=1 Tax=Mucor flavus TaxID=439312 RepID=A0ABP9ZBW6_9FUNG
MNAAVSNQVVNTWLPNSNCTEQSIETKEQNPFEQSFSTATIKANTLNPSSILSEANASLVGAWVSDTSSYTYDSNSINNDVYSVSDHQASEDSDDAFNTINPMTYQFEQQQPKKHNDNNSTSNQQQQYQYQTQFINTNVKSSRQSSKGSKKRSRSAKLPEDEEKRRNFLERNRLAALKCRQRKKQWLSNLQARVEYLANDNDQLQMETDALRKEITDLKTLLVSHKDCPQYNVALAANNNTVMQHQPQQPVYHHNFSMSN